MKKIYSEPKMLTRNCDMDTELLGASLDPNNPTDLPGGTEPGKDPNPDEDDEWGGAKGRDGWDANGLW